MDPQTDNRWLAIAMSRTVVRRAVAYAIVVGAILIGINHGEALVHGELTLTRLGQSLLTVMVPYVVSTLSSVGAMRQSIRATVSETRRDA